MRFWADETTCRSCQRLYSADDLDRYLWCPVCRAAVRRRSAVWGRVVGLISSLGVAAYLLIRVDPSRRFIAFYLLMLALTYLVTGRIAAAVVQGYCRARGSAPGVRPEDDRSSTSSRVSRSI